MFGRGVAGNSLEKQNQRQNGFIEAGFGLPATLSCAMPVFLSFLYTMKIEKIFKDISDN